MKLFDNAVAIATAEPEDTRPARLRELRDAQHPTCPYYRFLYNLGAELGPLSVIEIGTYVGTSAAHFAEPSIRGDFGQVVTVDIQPDAKLQVEALGYPNITAMTGDSLSDKILGQLKGRKFDVLYVDGLHNFSQAYREYFHYRLLVREGGIMIFDDVGLGMDGDEMNVLWDFIPEPKQRLDHLHTTGFGIVEKTTLNIPNPTLAMVAAMPVIQSRRRA